MKSFRFLFVCLFLFPAMVFAQSFRIDDIRLEGLQRVSAGTVFASLPVQAGQTVDAHSLQQATRALFRTGFFTDIELGRDGSVLVVTVTERPAISEIVIEGNKAIQTEDLLRGMNDNGLSEGQIFKESTLDGLTRELERQYVAQGRYSATVKGNIEELPRNQIKLIISVDEGSVASIEHLNIVGNTVFDDKELMELFELKTTGWLSWLNSNNRYSKEKLTGDIERLESYYLDRGYLRFNIDSTQVALSPDKEGVYITINVTEGEVYKVSEVVLAGELVVDEEQLKRLFLMREGQTFSQVLMTTSADYMTRRLGNDGYTFAEVKGIPEHNEEDSTVKITFFMEPGKRSYVRRVDFRGNTKTSDEVLRREMRQLEGASASTALIEHSKVRLERLGFFKEVETDTEEVPGSADLVDVEYTVEEQPSGSIGASIGFAQDSGVVLGANIQQNNWFGTGKSVGFNVSTSQYQTVYSFNYLDPYFTKDGVSRGFNVFFRSRDFEEVNVSSYTTDSFGGAVNFGYPISEISRLNFGVSATNISIETGSYASQEITTSPQLFEPSVYLKEYMTVADYNDLVLGTNDPCSPCVDAGYTGVPTPILSINDSMLINNPAGWLDDNGDEFNILSFNASWRKSTLNRGRLATRGAAQSVTFEASLPGGDLEYYKLKYSGQYFRPLTKSLTLRLKTELAYADSYGKTTRLPFFENFYAGGFGSVRGFKRNTLGPRATPAEQYVTAPYDNDGDGDLDSLAYILGADGTLLSGVVGENDDPFGGNILIEGSAEILFPLPFIKDQRTLQSAFFIDAGNVFDTSCSSSQLNCFDVDLGKLSVSAGLGVTWITGFGPLTFSVATPLKENEEDKTEFFQFSLGSSF